MIELGRIDILMKVPRVQHFAAAVHVMAHVNQRYNYRLVYDPLHPEINHIVLTECYWSEFYGDAKEAIPMNVPEPWRKRGRYLHVCR